ncbi:hypothetical protein DFH06DRAFT_1348517 [Mycena polygramma]|nr:hypothetical protein DFH06DRAFT_1348517 [Mycena polygramma]
MSLHHQMPPAVPHLVHLNTMAGHDLRYRWAALLCKNTETTASVAIACDDAIAFSLFGQVKERAPKWHHDIARLSARDEDLIDLAAAEQLRTAFKDAQALMLDANQTYDGLLKATTNLVDQKWTRKALGEGYKLAQVMLWCLRSMVVLLAAWSPVKLSLVKLGEDERVQFGIRAQACIEADALIYEMVGQLSSDSVDGKARAKTTALSEMSAFDGSSRVLFGPIRFVNHSCKPNTVFELQERGITLRTVRDIAPGEEVTVDYGAEYWEEGHKCLCDICEPQGVKADPGPSRIIDPVRQEKAKKEKAKRPGATTDSATKTTLSTLISRRSGSRSSGLGPLLERTEEAAEKEQEIVELALFPASGAALGPFAALADSLPKYYPPGSLRIFALARQWKSRHPLLSVPAGSVSHLHLLRECKLSTPGVGGMYAHHGECQRGARALQSRRIKGLFDRARPRSSSGASFASVASTSAAHTPASTRLRTRLS